MSADRAVGRLRAVLAGKARPYTRAGSLSAIDKRVLDGAVAVDSLGLAGDEQGDLRVHGGPDKAVHCYAWAHYEAWRSDLSAQADPQLLRQPGAFGENFSLEPGLDEAGVCIADHWRIGSALFEISQGRQPCWKLNDRFAEPGMAMRMQRSGRAGWYLRVLQPGLVRAGDTVFLEARPHPDWSIARLLSIIDRRDCDPALLSQVLALPLPASWQRLFARRRATGQAESWAARMEGGEANSSP